MLSFRHVPILKPTVTVTKTTRNLKKRRRNLYVPARYSMSPKSSTKLNVNFKYKRQVTLHA